LKSNLISKSETSKILEQINSQWKIELPKQKNIKTHEVDEKGVIITGDGILNGTTNYILTNMANGMSFNDALGDAKQKGYVEADESLDLDGLDAAAKLVILANWIMGMKVTMPDIKRTGIRKIDSSDIKRAVEKNCAIKLIASCSKELTVAPKEIATVDPLCVSGTLNAISFTSEHSGTQTIIGRGAGGIETASSILRDLIDIRNESTKT